MALTSQNGSRASRSSVRRATSGTSTPDLGADHLHRLDEIEPEMFLHEREDVARLAADEAIVAARS